MNNFSTVKKPTNLIAAITLVLLFATCNLFGQKIDKKCNVIYANYLEKDSLLKVCSGVNDSLSNTNKELQLLVNKLQAQLDVIDHEAKLIKIGNQKWDTDNLKVTTLNDGTPIFYADTRAKWDSLFRIGEPAYCYHKNDSIGSYGYMYNYYAMESGKLATAGMRIPSKEDVGILIKFLDTETLEGSLLLKSKDSSNAQLPGWKVIGSDKFGMNIKPCGFRLDDSKEWYFANKVYYWCQSNVTKKIEMMVITEINDDPFILEKTVEEKNSNYGLYVRCIKQ
jgi:uncharacterized protein (TIGR02145 family)